MAESSINAYNVSLNRIKTGGGVNLTDIEGPINSTNQTLGSFAPPDHLYMLVYSTVLICVIFLCGVLGNLAAIVVFARLKSMPMVTRACLINLSVADLMVLCVCVPVGLISIYCEGRWYLGAFICKLVPMVDTAVCVASIMTMVLIACERHWTICRSKRFNITESTLMFRVKLVIAGIWLLSFGLSFPLGVLYNHETSPENVSECYADTQITGTKVYIVSTFILYYIMPAMLLCGLYFSIGAFLFKNSKISSVKGSALQRRNRQVILMLAMVVVIFFLCLLPYRCILLWLAVGLGEDGIVWNVELFQNVLQCARILCYMNSACNPIVYNVTNERFRRDLRRLLGDCLPCLSNEGLPQLGTTRTVLSDRKQKHLLHKIEDSPPNAVWKKPPTLDDIRAAVTAPMGVDDGNGEVGVDGRTGLSVVAIQQLLEDRHIEGSKV